MFHSACTLWDCLCVFWLFLLVQRGFNWIIYDHYTQATRSIESVFNVFTAKKKWKGFSNNTAIMPQNLLQGFSSPSGLKSRSHNLTLFGLLSEAQPSKGVFFVLSSDSANCFYWEQLKFDVFCWLVYFLFILFKPTQGPFSSCCSNRTILDGKIISVETIWKSFEHEVETAVNFAVDAVIGPSE